MKKPKPKPKPKEILHPNVIATTFGRGKVVVVI